MSLIVPTFGIFSIKPKFWEREGVLHSRSSLFVQLIFLFSYKKTVTVDPLAKEVTIRHRFLWVFRIVKRVSFHEITRIDYSFASWGTSWNRLGERRDQQENFNISLILRGDKYVSLWDFMGEGSVADGIRGMLLGDSLVDFSGNQEDASRRYVTLVKKYTGKTLT